MVPKKLIKLSKDMRVDTITKQNKKDFAPLCFGEVHEEQKQEKESPKVSRRPSEVSPKSNRSTAKRAKSRRNRREESPQKTNKAPQKTNTDTKPKRNPSMHKYNPLVTVLCALLERKEHDEKQCNNSRLFKIYNRRVLLRIEKLCQELTQLEGMQSELSWVQKSLLPFLNNFAIYYSHVCKDLHKKENFSYARELEQWLYEELSNECAQLNWFSIQKVYPYRDRFIEGVHTQKRVVSIQENLHDTILEIRALGLVEPQGDDIVEPSQVVVGIYVQNS